MLNICNDMNLLYVEDNHIEKTITMLRFSKFFKKIYFVDNATDALEVFEKHKIDLIITDIVMPDITGLEFTKIIREKNYFIPIIIITGHPSNDYLLEIANLSVQGYLQKPVSNEDFYKTIYRVTSQYFSEKVDKIKLTSEIYYIPYESSILKNDTTIKLTKKEKLLLDLFLKNKNKLLSYRNIEFFIWEENEDVMTENSLKTLIKNLRNKTSKEMIKNISGLGYRFTA